MRMRMTGECGIESGRGSGNIETEVAEFGLLLLAKLETQYETRTKDKTKSTRIPRMSPF